MHWRSYHGAVRNANKKGCAHACAQAMIHGSCVTDMFARCQSMCIQPGCARGGTRSRSQGQRSQGGEAYAGCQVPHGAQGVSPAGEGNGQFNPAGGEAA